MPHVILAHSRGRWGGRQPSHLVELAEELTATLDHADWCLFQKNGTDATTACITIARAGTGRRKIILARGAYHGAVPWCSPSVVGVTAEDRAHLIPFDWGDTTSLDAAVAQAGDDLAAIILTAFRHDVGRDQEMPTTAFLQAARAHCDATGALPCGRASALTCAAAGRAMA
ncbi:MAG: hypothetical protein R3D90_12780 [Paracoccaceae bacterium]